MLRVAVECAPATAPNSSLSISVSGSAAFDEGMIDRRPFSCTIRAIWLSPVPDSPVSRMLTSSGLTTATSRSSAASAALLPPPVFRGSEPLRDSLLSKPRAGSRTALGRVLGPIPRCGCSRERT